MSNGKWKMRNSKWKIGSAFALRHSKPRELSLERLAAFVYQPSPGVDLPGGLHAKEIGEFAIVRGLVNYKVSDFPSLQRAELVASSKAICRVDRGCRYRLRRRHLHVRRGQGK